MTNQPAEHPMKGHNGGPSIDGDSATETFDSVSQEIEDLYQTAKDFADGEPIDSQEMADEIGRIHAGLHDAGKRLDALRVEAKKPLDEKIKEIQDLYNPYVQPKKGKVDLGKSALNDLLTPWRAEQKRIADEAAAAAAAEAERKQREAEEAIRASSGNLSAREEAEAQLKEAKSANKDARRAEREANTGTGLRTVWVTEIESLNDALDWAFARDEQAFRDLALSMAREQVQRGVRNIPGFKITDTKVAR